MSDEKQRLPCPFCQSEKVLAEGSDRRLAMVCQKCLARGPEVNVSEGRNAAIEEWNKAIRQPPTPAARHECENCGLWVVRIWYGTNQRFGWRHIGRKGFAKKACKNLKVKSTTNPQRPMSEERKSGWQCDLGNGQFDHDWVWVDDWTGDPGVIGGTMDCGFWRCRACEEEDHQRPRPASE